ncbi:hypothetical protein [Streptomyces sp. NPDC001652]|uniref:hypothetical protein n=1 Tax=Streptomyces sp. NPDC001652 TaxID=3154393 RepID=UPI00332841EA
MAAVTAAAAAATGLIFSAWTTYISQEVARDQLSQSKEQNEGEERSQVALVNAWEEHKKDALVLVIVNRSLDPIKDVMVGIILSGSTDPLDENSHELKVATLGTTDSIPPCSKVEIETEDIYATDKEGNVKLDYVSFVDYFLSFRDANAKGWERQRDGTIKQVSHEGSTPSQKRYLSYMETEKYDGPHQAQIDHALRSYAPLDCGKS